MNEPPQINSGRLFAEWMLTFLAFPLGGVAALSIFGQMADVFTAALGGALAGLLIGLGQWIILLRHLGMKSAWILSTASGLMLGNTVGIVLTDGGTQTTDLIVLGLAGGLGVGITQATILRRYLRLAALWAPAVAISWPIGWIVTSAVGVNIEFGYVVFDTVGALVFSALTGAVMLIMVRASNTAKRVSASSAEDESSEQEAR